MLMTFLFTSCYNALPSTLLLLYLPIYISIYLCIYIYLYLSITLFISLSFFLSMYREINYREKSLYTYKGLDTFIRIIPFYNTTLQLFVLNVKTMDAYCQNTLWLLITKASGNFSQRNQNIKRLYP